MSKSVIEIPGYEEYEDLELLDRAINDFKPKYVIGMFSGGHDSLVAIHIASQHPAFSFALHINTGIGIEQTRDFVRNTCKEWGIELREYKAAEYVGQDGKPAPQVYEELVMERGFPGAGHHTKMYNRLKERPLRHAIRDLDRKRTDKTMLISGVRQQESKRRKRNVDQVQLWEGTKVFVAPIWNYSKKDVNTYLTDNNLKRNPVVDILHSSGECLCGAYARPGELAEIEAWGFEEGKYLRELEKKIKAVHGWGWDEKPRSSNKDQASFWNDEEEFQLMCVGCKNADKPEFVDVRDRTDADWDERLKDIYEGESE